MDKITPFTSVEKKKADAQAVAASNDLGCIECDADRRFKPIRYKRNGKGVVELISWRLLDGWRGPYCPTCQKKRDDARAATAAKIEKARQANLARIQKARTAVEKKRRQDGERQQKELLKKIGKLVDAKTKKREG